MMPATIDRDVTKSERLRVAVRILVQGQVQGVGFRPFVYRLANACQLNGCVGNCSDGVAIELEGEPERIATFRVRLIAESPAGAAIDRLGVADIAVASRQSFVIAASHPGASLHVRLPQDTAICANCQHEIFAPLDRRYCYPFTNCTECGPRYSIIKSMPYDRPATTMRRFKQCPECQREYHTPDNRRFYAQPNACADCGPRIVLWDQHGRTIAGHTEAIPAAAQLLILGQVVAVKGLGGFQLLVRADDDLAVRKLRLRKNRPTKPLAVMVPSIAAAEAVAEINEVERRMLQSRRNPIVLLQRKRLQSKDGISSTIAPHLESIGLLLPTTPLHHLLLAEVGVSVVATSGNVNEEPIVINENEAITRLAGVADAFLVHDRPIVRRVDDSVVQAMANRATTIRLARGFAPLPLPAIERLGGPPMLATGGHQCSALALWNGRQAVLAQHIGDLDHADTRSAFVAAAADLCELYGVKPIAIACDQHPDYFSTQWAVNQSVPVIRVQHHHAHAAAGMVEHDLLHQEVLAITWDGTGFGTDGTMWGGEFLKARIDGFERLASLLPLPLPGGEAAIRNPNRIAFGLMHVLLGANALLSDPRLLAQLGIAPNDAALLSSMIQRGVQTPWSSSVGRLFDAVAAVVLAIRNVTYEGEAAVRLEAVADPVVEDAYDLPMTGHNSLSPVGDSSCPRGDWRPMLTQLLADHAAETPVGVMAAKFHNALVRWAINVAGNHGASVVVLSGGCFQNRWLTSRIVDGLLARGHRVYPPGEIPPGDGGLAVGQLAIALAMSGSSLLNESGR